MHGCVNVRLCLGQANASPYLAGHEVGTLGRAYGKTKLLVGRRLHGDATQHDCTLGFGVLQQASWVRYMMQC